MQISVRFSRVLSPLLLTAGILASATPAHAQTLRIIDDFVGPRSSEQFFLEGIERLEQEIDELQDGTDIASDPEAGILIIAPSIEEQRQRIEQQSMSQDAWSSANTVPLLSCIPD